MNTRIATTIVLLPFTVLMGCGASFSYGKPWQPDEAKFFDDGVDVIEDPTQLSGEFRYQVEQELEGRTSLADLVAEVTVTSVQTTKALDGQEQKHLWVRVTNELYGKAPENPLVLTASQSALGYTLITRYEDRLIGDWILFARYFRNQDGTVGHHFHLSPRSDALRKEIERLLEKRTNIENQVVE